MPRRNKKTPMRFFETPLERIPKDIHLIWFGKKPLPEKYAYHILLSHAMNSPHGYDVHLWVNPEFFELEDPSTSPEYALVNILRDNGVIIRNYRHAFAETDPIIFQFIDRIRFINASAASDILRWKVLEKYGGIYIDTDNTPLLPYPREHILLQKNTPFLVDHTTIEDCIQHGTNTHFIAAPRDSKIVTSMMKHFRNAPWITDTDEMVSQWTFWMVIDTTGPTAINEIEYRHDAKFVRCAARRHPDTAGRNHFTCDFTWRDMVPRETIPYQMLGTDRLERDKCDYMRFWEDYHDCDGNVELLNCVNRYELFCIKPVKKEKDTDAAAGPS